jgi:hypothetical protein
MGCSTPHGLRDENPDSLLAHPSRRRQRLPVQLWGQLLRPCRVLGAATDSWSLQRRCSAAMTRCGRARLAGGAAQMVSTPRLVGIKGRAGGVNTGSGPLTQSIFGPQRSLRYRKTRSNAQRSVVPNSARPGAYAAGPAGEA